MGSHDHPIGSRITLSVAVDPGPGPLTRSFAHGARSEAAAGSPGIGNHPTRLPASARHGAFYTTDYRHTFINPLRCPNFGAVEPRSP